MVHSSSGSHSSSRRYRLLVLLPPLLTCVQTADDADNADGRPQVFSGYMCDRYFRSPVPLVAVFEALARLGQLDALFAEMAEKLRKEVIAPLLSPRYVPPPKVQWLVLPPTRCKPGRVRNSWFGRANGRKGGRRLCVGLFCLCVWFVGFFLSLHLNEIFGTGRRSSQGSASDWFCFFLFELSVPRDDRAWVG